MAKSSVSGRHISRSARPPVAGDEANAGFRIGRREATEARKGFEPGDQQAPQAGQKRYTRTKPENEVPKEPLSKRLRS